MSRWSSIRRSHGLRQAGLIFCALVGILAGVGTYTFYYADGAAYLSNNPATCANCHIMQDQFQAWQKGPHHAVAVCNDCHAPHDSLAHKLFVKGVNGVKHSFAFTTHRYPDNFEISDFNRRVTEHACRDCHEGIVHEIESPAGFGEISCIRCHSDVGHE
jgi:cytochrome c nitrite reductase small subunit